MPNSFAHILYSNLIDAIINRISFHGLEAGALDHFDDLLLGHFYFAAGFDGVAVGELAAVGDRGRSRRNGDRSGRWLCRAWRAITRHLFRN